MNQATAKQFQKVMGLEIARSMEQLRSPGHPKPYFVSYLLREEKTYQVWARYGSLYNDRQDIRRQCYADVRVGSYTYDQTFKGGLSDNSDEAESFDLIDMPIDSDTDALRFSLWRLTDARYREAVKAYHSRKARDISFLDSNKKLPSFTPVKKAKAQRPLKAFKVDQASARQLVKKASMVFKDYPEIKNSYVEYHAHLETKIFVSSEGVERVWQVPHYQVIVYLWFLNKKCNEDFSLSYMVRDAKELPTLLQLKKDIKAKIQTLYDMEKGDTMTSYAGPVLMAPRPAGLFLHEVVGHRLEGSRLLSDDEGRTFKDKLGKKIMHDDLTIIDDPKLQRFNGRSLVGHYPFDDEGVEPEPTVLVENGVLKSFLSTRAPLRKQPHKSNGHARNQSFERPVSRMGNLLIQAKNGLTWDQMKQALIDEVKRCKRPFGIILYEVEGGETGTEAYDFQAFMGEITIAVKVFPDGREKLIKGVDFVGTPLSSLNQIMAVGEALELDNAFCGAESGTIPVSTISPALLLSNLELQAKNPTKVTQYRLPLPWFDRCAFGEPRQCWMVSIPLLTRSVVPLFSRSQAQLGLDLQHLFEDFEIGVGGDFLRS